MITQITRRIYHSKYFGPLCIALVVLLANGPAVFGPYTHNPLYMNSGLLVKSQPSTLLGLNTIDPTDGTSSQSLGRAAVRQIAHGRIPWWNHNEQLGAPLAGDMQSAALFPLVVFYALPFGFLLVHLSLELIAGLFAYALIKKLGASRYAAIFGGILFGLCGIFSWFGSANINPVPFLPMLLYGLEIAFTASERRLTLRRGWFWIGSGLALSLYAGFPEVAYLNGLFAAGWFIVRLFGIERGLRSNFITRVFLGGGVGLLVSLPIIISFIVYLPYADVSIHSGANTAALPVFGIAGMLMPYVYGTIFGYTGYYQALIGWWGSVGGYISSLVVFLAVVGLRTKKLTNKLKWFILAVAVISILRIYGFPGLAWVLNLIPGMSVTAADRYLMPLVCGAGAILAAFGLDKLVEINHDSLKKKLQDIFPALAVFLVSTIFSIFLAISIHKHLSIAFDHNLWLNYSIIWSFVGVGAVATMALWCKKVALKKLVVGIVVLLDTIGFFIIPQLSAVKQPVVDLVPVTYIRANLGTYRFFSLGPISANYGSYYGIASINTNNIPIVKSWSQYVHTKLNPTVPPVSFNGQIQKENGPTQKQEFLSNIKNFEYIGVKYVVASRNYITPYEANEVGLTMTFQDSAVEIFTLPSPASYFQSNDGCSIKETSRDNLTATCLHPVNLKRLESYMPGWVATVNSHQQPVFETPDHFQSVRLKSGTNTISFSYAPEHIIIGYVAALIGLGVIFYCWAYSARSGKDRR